MEKAGIISLTTVEKVHTTRMDKFLGPLPREEKATSLFEWATVYYEIKVRNAPTKTEQAKSRDLNRFLSFFTQEVGHDQVDAWTPAVSRSFVKHLRKSIVPTTGKPYAPTSINRIMATIRHFGRWLHTQRPCLAGNPLEGVKDVQEEEPRWNGLTDRQITRCKVAIDQRLHSCTRADQNPKLEAAVFYTLLYTGLRESELCDLCVDQYHHRGFHQVYRRKGQRYSKKVTLPQEARMHLDAYLTEQDPDPGDPIFLSRFGRPLQEQDVRRICLRISNQACAQLPTDQAFDANPHKLRHTFLKRVADKQGIHFAQALSGNVSMREIFRYTRPSDQEREDAAEHIFD